MAYRITLILKRKGSGMDTDYVVFPEGLKCPGIGSIVSPSFFLILTAALLDILDFYEKSSSLHSRYEECARKVHIVGGHISEC